MFVGTETQVGALQTHTVPTPDGPFSVIADDQAVLASGWTDDPEFFLVRFHLGKDTVFVSDQPATGPSRLALAAVMAYYDADPSLLSQVPLAQSVGPFHERARAAMHAIAYGQRISYTDLAARAGNPRASRAAAAACASNHTALFMPCHRVVRSDGSLGGFLYGLLVKQSLLDREAGARA